MTNYIFRTTVWKETTDVIGIDTEAEAANKLDFETNYKDETMKVTSLHQDGAILIELSYADFSEKIDFMTFQWHDVKLVTMDNKYELNLLITDTV